MAPRSPCVENACAWCCYDTEMPITEEDVARLVAKGHDRAAFSKRSNEGFLMLNTRDPKEGETRRPCFFLHEDRCSAYADRPQGCRIYPLVMSEQGRLMRDEDCPHRAQFPVDPSAKRRIQKIYATLKREMER